MSGAATDRQARTGCIAFTGGGTGGHVFPGLAVIERLRGRFKGRIVWIGSDKEMERKAVEAAGVEFFAIPTGKLRRSFSLRNLSDSFKVAAGFFAARRLLRELRPSLVFSKGGYVSVPPCLAASSLGIPVFTHESDLSPGLATKINARRAEKILVSWERTLGYLPEDQRARAIVAGNPVRAAIGHGDASAGRAWLGFEPGMPIVLALGGSQGAAQVNGLVSAILPALADKAALAHQTGSGNAPCRPADRGYHGFEFVTDELPDLLAAADIIIGRAGAGTLWEGAAAGKPMVFVPLGGQGSRGDQLENARLLADAGAAVNLAGDRATPENLMAAIMPLIESPEARAAMAGAARQMARPDAAGMIADMLLERIGKDA